jgi:hypothetical protein
MASVRRLPFFYGNAPGAGALRRVVALVSFFPVVAPKRAQ